MRRSTLKALARGGLITGPFRKKTLIRRSTSYFLDHLCSADERGRMSEAEKNLSLADVKRLRRMCDSDW